MTQYNPNNVQFLTLGKVPFHHWLESVRECLHAMGCLNYIDKSFNYKKELTEVEKLNVSRSKNLIKASVNEQDRDLIFDCANPREMVEKLQLKYRSNDSKNIFELLRENRKITYDGSISKLFAEVRRNVLHLSEKDLKLPDSFIIDKVISVLPEQFKDLCDQFELFNIREETRLSSQNFESKLLRREADLNESEKPENTTLVVAKKRYNNVKCNFCGLKGHIERFCRQKKKSNQSGGSNQSTHQNKRNNKGDKNDDENKSNVHVTTLVSAVALIATDDNIVPKFLADSAASFHIVNDINLLTNRRKTNRTIRGLKQTVTNTITGDIECEFFDGQKWQAGKITDAAYIPDQPFNLISVGQLCKLDGVKVETNSDGMVIHRYGKTIVIANWSKQYINLFDVQMRVQKNVIAASASSIENSMALWHERCAHFSIKTLSKMFKDQLVDGVPKNVQDDAGFCSSCQSGKITDVPHRKRENRQHLVPGSKLHIDIGGYTTRSIHGNMYFLVAVDEFSGFIKIVFMKNRTETLNSFKRIVNEVKLDTGNDVLCIRSDHGSEFMSNDFKSFLSSKGIIHELSVVKTPQQNGRIERTIRNIVDHSISMLSSSNLPLSLWDEATNCCVYVINRMLKSKNFIPFEKYCGSRADLSNLRIFGSVGYSMIKDDRHKFESKTKKVFMVGYHSSNTYRVYCPHHRRIELTCAVKFDEQTKCEISYHPKNSDSISVSISDSDSDIFLSDSSDNVLDFVSNVTNPNIENRGSIVPNELNPNINVNANVSNDDDSDEETNSNDDVANRSRGRPLGSRNRVYEQNIERIESLRSNQQTSQAIVAVAGSEPSTFNEAINSTESQKWKAAMNHEFESLIKNKTWDLVDPVSDKQIISVKWVYSIKEDGRYRARLVARGFEQKDKSVFDCYAPVTCMDSVRLFFSLAASMDMTIIQFDVSCAFLNGSITGEVYICQPPGFDDGSGRICKLNRGLYGLRDSPKSWNILFDQTARNFGFKSTILDPCFYFINEPNKLTIMIVYVDDGLIASTDKHRPLKIFNEFQRKFEVRKIDRQCFLGIEFIRNRQNRTILLHQEKYLLNKLKTFNMAETRPTKTPFAVGNDPYDENSPINTIFPYREAVGALLYLSCKTRPDIAYTVSLLARFSNSVREIHIQSVKRLFRYLNHTRNMGINVGGKQQLIGYSDADLAGDKQNYRTTTGHLIFYGGPVLWKTKLHRVTIDNTTEAEYVAASLCSKDIRYVQNMLNELGISTETPVLYCDNQSSIHQIYGSSISHKLRHISIKYHMIRGQVENGNMIVKWINSADQLADILTKPLTAPKHNSLVDQILKKKLRGSVSKGQFW